MRQQMMPIKESIPFICRTRNGTPGETRGRKVTGLSLPLGVAMVAGPPNVRLTAIAVTGDGFLYCGGWWTP